MDGAPSAADLPLLADLKRRHATITRRGEQYHVTASGPATLNGKAVAEGVAVGLRTGDSLTLGADVGFQFSIPSPLSNTARLVCTSGHRPRERVDGVVLLEQVCQLGPQADHHIVCPRVEAPLILFLKGGRLWCRSPLEWTLDGVPVAGSAPLFAGAVVATETLSFRLEVQ
jgi:hypothetical protein